MAWLPSPACFVGLPDGHSFMVLDRSAFITTVNDAIAAPENIGDIRMPDTG